jgi:hypothetical protein
LENCKASVDRLLAIEEADPVRESDQEIVHIRYEEKPEKMATWMTFVLSAPSLPLRETRQESSSGYLVKRSHNPLPIVLPQPKPILGTDTQETMFNAKELDTKALEEYNFTWESRSAGSV